MENINRSHPETAVSIADSILSNIPAVFATGSYHNTSDRYTFIPTTRIINALQEVGFVPASAMQMVSRNRDRRNYAKHTISFVPQSQAGALAAPSAHHIESDVPRILLTNSHDK